MPVQQLQQGWTPYTFALAITMLVTGSINTLSTKWADRQSSVGKDGRDPRLYDHPFVQALGMFFGEMLCLFAFMFIWSTYKCRGLPWVAGGEQKFNILIFLPPALLDMIATSLMYTALNLTYPSSYQMLRGSVIVFTALLSVAFLGRYIYTHMWIGIGFVVIGLLMVGLADMLFTASSQAGGMNAIIAGDLLIIIACIVTSSQMVYEEKFVKRYGVHPLRAVGSEGLCGFVVLAGLLVVMYFIKGIPAPFSCGPEGRLEDVPDALAQMHNNYIIIVATVGNVISIAMFNFAGISVTKKMSATTRMVVDSMRTIIVWSVSLAVGWQPVDYHSILIQLGGFALLIAGMFIYNDLIFAPFLRRRGLLRSSVQADARPGLHSAEHEVTIGDDEGIASDDRRQLLDPNRDHTINT